MIARIALAALLALTGCTANEERLCHEFGASVRHDSKLIDNGFDNGFGNGWTCLVRCDDEWVPSRQYVGCPFRHRAAREAKKVA